MIFKRRIAFTVLISAMVTVGIWAIILDIASNASPVESTVPTVTMKNYAQVEIAKPGVVYYTTPTATPTTVPFVDSAKNQIALMLNKLGPVILKIVDITPNPGIDEEVKIKAPKATDLPATEAPVFDTATPVATETPVPTMESVIVPTETMDTYIHPLIQNVDGTWPDVISVEIPSMIIDMSTDTAWDYVKAGGKLPLPDCPNPLPYPNITMAEADIAAEAQVPWRVHPYIEMYASVIHDLIAPRGYSFPQEGIIKVTEDEVKAKLLTLYSTGHIKGCNIGNSPIAYNMQEYYDWLAQYYLQ